jgi:CHAD domain-containing protein
MAKQSHIVWDISKNAAENASSKLPKMARAYFRKGRALFEAAPSTSALHSFRLDTKRFRYTLELFRSLYGPGLDRRLALLRSMQDYLGEINDCAATQKLVGRRRPKIAAFLQNRMTHRARVLTGYWRRTFDAPGQEQWWTDYLARFAKE